ncbi:argininosuccinate lyase [Acidaminobacter sp. JC074]|uniref:argininosuccinate lyase n=1 Tax=Acidaminobacter sp. JC074 TaxID=2530199 RepID=UPI001F0E87C5|nr:argininosuccinate lyase [Acidaminobacter sp. JC074]MCH4886607.1 argininosuccinate lyase [Acidaminobacter sp. JC074]
MKAWQGRFSEATHELMEKFNASIVFDKRLYKVDIKGTIAHVKMLSSIGVLTPKEKDTLVKGLEVLLKDIEAGQVEFSLADEDIHMGIERVLTERLGPVAKKMHTGRSRNDQVATDIRLYVKDAILDIQVLLMETMTTLLKLSSEHAFYMMPGYTHLQKAQPIYLSYHLNAYIHMFKRDYERLEDVLKRTDVLPLGSGALAGVNYDSDRELVAEILNFTAISSNGLDAVSDRDFIIEFQSALSLIMMHLSRLSEELIMWQTEQFSYITIGDAFTTGSSLMPQKKNPDACELIRGKTGRVFGSLMNILTVMKSLPLAYNKDMQEDKEGLFDSVDTVGMILSLLSPMLESVVFHEDKMKKDVYNSFLNATELADYLVSKDFPFREAHHLTGELVKYCIDNDIYLLDLPLDVYRSYTPLIDASVYDALDFENAIENKLSYGSTSKKSIEADFEIIKGFLESL